jgi:hypothetical protein
VNATGWSTHDAAASETDLGVRMSLLTICTPCQMGDHKRHHRVVQAAPEGGVGGSVCTCEGECIDHRYELESTKRIGTLIDDAATGHDARIPSNAERTERGIEPRWPAELWWCIACGEPSDSDPCQFCGEPIAVYKVVKHTEHEAVEHIPPGEMTDRHVLGWVADELSAIADELQRKTVRGDLATRLTARADDIRVIAERDCSTASEQPATRPQQGPFRPDHSPFRNHSERLAAESLAKELYKCYREAFTRCTPAGNTPRWKHVRPKTKRVWVNAAKNMIRDQEQHDG